MLTKLVTNYYGSGVTLVPGRSVFSYLSNCEDLAIKIQKMNDSARWPGSCRIFNDNVFIRLWSDLGCLRKIYLAKFG